MKRLLLGLFPLFAMTCLAADGSASMNGVASWYGEAHRGKPMANRQPFDPNKLTAASWFYPLGTKVKVSLRSEPAKSVIVTITDRGPARRYVRKGRLIDLARGAFVKIAPAEVGLVRVSIEAIPEVPPQQMAQL